MSYEYGIYRVLTEERRARRWKAVALVLLVLGLAGWIMLIDLLLMIGAA